MENNIVPLPSKKTRAQLEHELMLEVNNLKELMAKLEAECALLNAWNKSNKEPSK